MDLFENDECDVQGDIVGCAVVLTIALIFRRKSAAFFVDAESDESSIRIVAQRSLSKGVLPATEKLFPKPTRKE